MKTVSDSRETIISVVGAGSWGTTIAQTIAENNPDYMIRLWAYEHSVTKSINSFHINMDYLPGIILAENIYATNSLRECLERSSGVILATPSKVVVDTCARIKKHVTDTIQFGFVSKGLCRYHHEILTISDTIGRIIPSVADKVTAISGPTHAEEVSRKYHTCIGIGSRSAEAREFFRELIESEYLACRCTDDVMGIELGGALKNPAAVAAGIIQVLKRCGDNLSGALMAESLKEMIAIGRIMGARVETIIDISGLGDLITTAMSSHSRNRRFGMDIGGQILRSGKSVGLYDKMLLRLRPERVIARMSEKLHYLAEGAYAIEPLIEIANQHKITLPVYMSLYEVLLKRKDPKLLIETIKNPERFGELSTSIKIKTLERKQGMEKTGGSIFRNVILKNLNDKITINNEYTHVLASYLSGISGSDHEIRNSPSVTREKELIKSLSGGVKEYGIRNLSAFYLDEMADRYSHGIYRIIAFMKSMSLIFRNIFCPGCKGSHLRNVTGSHELLEMRRMSTKMNTVYIGFGYGGVTAVDLIMMLNRTGMSIPRFCIDSKYAGTGIKRYILKKMGAYVIDFKRLQNPLYREVLLEYLSCCIEHGIPILIHNDFNCPSIPEKDWLMKGVLNVIIEKFKETTEETVIIPFKLFNIDTNTDVQGTTGKGKGKGRDEPGRCTCLELMPGIVASEYMQELQANEDIREHVMLQLGLSGKDVEKM